MTAPHPAVLAIGVVLVAAAAGSGDYQLAPAGICATDRSSCELARQRIAEGSLWPDLDRAQKCLPHPGCRDPSSLCIENYNCQSRGRR